MANRNIFQAQIFIEALAQSGLDAVCAAPGSRHTPLMLAFANHPAIQVYSHLDERSAAFFALGLAMASQKTVALVCTSGTAGANMYPAVIEAHQSRVPLLVLTADRPHELRHSGANQTIDQIKLFGDSVLWFVDAALPESNPPEVAIRNLQTLAVRALATANGLRKGVVHINLPFRKPLEPTPVAGDRITLESPPDDNRMTISRITPPSLNSRQAGERLKLETLDLAESGIIICGRNCQPEALPLFGMLSQATGFPLLADSLSGVRFMPQTGGVRLGGFESYLTPDLLPGIPDMVLRFGDLPLSKSLNQLLQDERIRFRYTITKDGIWMDDTHYPSEVITADMQSFITDLIDAIGQPVAAPDPTWQQLETVTWETIEAQINTGDYFDGAVVYDVVDLIPDGSTMFAGNSLPVRHLEQFGKPQQKQIHVFANRGASGIDGNISTALGAGIARPSSPLVAIMGDITFYHDMNGLLAVHRCGVPVTIILLNNDGGGIFHRLPIRDYDPAFTDYFITAHGLDFSHAAALYGLEHVLIDARDDNPAARDLFRQAFATSVSQRSSTIIEIRTDSQQDDARRQQIVRAVQAAITESI